MAAQKSNMGLHITLIFSVMFNLIFLVMAYMFYSSDQETRTELAKANEAKTTAENTARERGAQIDALKSTIGHDRATVGDVGSTDTQTVIGQMNQDMQDYGRSTQASSYSATMASLRQELDNALRQLAQAENLQKTAERTRDQHEQQWRIDVTQFQTQLTDTNRIFQQDKDRLNEDINSKNSTISQLNTEKQRLTADLHQTVADHEEVVANYEQDVREYRIANDRLWEKINDEQRVSFEVADGIIRWVDHITGLVWINVGALDNLPKETTFSVYVKDHHGVGRGAEYEGRGIEDIKGQIEVTRILGDHLAEARILSNDTHRPIAPGDPIYTPLWTPGAREGFAFVGFIDLDGDGRNDRDLLHDIVHGAGAVITAEVDDDGVRHGGPLDSDTKFLVKGALPDPAEVEPNEIDTALKINEEFTAIVEEARKQGVRQVSLSDFVSYIGYRPTQRLWRPGEPYPYKLNAGSQSTGIDETYQDRSASGSTSGIYSRSKRLKTPTSSGQTSKIFGGQSKSTTSGY